MSKSSKRPNESANLANATQPTSAVISTNTSSVPAGFASSQQRSSSQGKPRAARWFGKRSAIIWALLLIGLIAYAIVVPIQFADALTTMDYDAISQPPSWAHPFGTDQLGRDVLILTAAGLKISLLIGSVAALGSTVIGMIVGIALAFAPGWVDRIVMRLVDVANSVPHLLLGIIIVSLYRGSLTVIILSIMLTHWTGTTRIIRALLLQVREQPFIDAAVLAGLSSWRIGREHYLPAVIGQMMVSMMLQVPHAVWHESTLSFLGLGLSLESPSLGILLQDAQSSFVLGTWWQVVFPAGVLVLATMAIGAIGTAIRSSVALDQVGSAHVH